MKTIINKWNVLLLAGVALTACSKQTQYDDTSFGAVDRLLFPSDGEEVELIEQTDAHLYFEWEETKSGTPIYTVVFMDAEKHEVGRYLADNNGQKASLKMLHSQINMVAGDAGIEPGAVGDLYWTVCAGLGGVEKITVADPHRLSVTRYASIDAPVHLYVTGEGSEFSGDPTKAQEMRRLGGGRFEIYTKFSGTFCFVNRNEEGNKRTFGVSEKGRLVEAADAKGEGEGIYHVSVDFNSGTVAMERIESMKYHYCSEPDPAAEMEYAGNGVWKYGIRWAGGDDRYRFDVVIDGGDYVWGYSEPDMSNAPTSLNGSGYNISMREAEGLDRWSHAFKFFHALKDIDCTIVLDCSPAAANYYHYFEFGFEPEAKAVLPTKPDADAAVELSAIAGSSESFSWSLPGDMTTAEKQLTTYALVFYGDAAAATEIARSDAGMNLSVSVSHAELESHAAKAGIGAEATGDLYWAVESELLGSTAVSEVRKLVVTRLKGVPQAAYITGAASEFGDGFQQLKPVGAGKFEIFTRLSVGAYNFTDGTEAGARRFVVEGNAIVERDGAITCSEEGIYYILLDFLTGEASYKKIENMRYLSPNVKTQHTDKQIVLPYRGNGVWYAERVVPYLADWDDDRYFFWAEVDGVTTKFGADPAMSGDLNAAPEKGDPRFRVYWPIADVNNDDAGAFKMLHSYRGNTTKRVNITLDMSPDTEEYYNYIEYLD